MTLVPAYGRDYRSKKELLADWNANKDFQTADIMSGYGHYTNKADLQKLQPGSTVYIRYKHLTQVASVKV